MSVHGASVGAGWEPALGGGGAALVQRCLACRHAQHYDRPVCVSCGARDLILEPTSGRASVLSFTVIHRSPLASLRAPYVLALVRLEEGPVVMSHIVGIDPREVACDLPVSADSLMLDDGSTLTVFRPSTDRQE
jgi:uncharacterized protein